LDLTNTLRDERKTAELQRLEKNFYEQVGLHLAGLEKELSGIGDPYSVEAQIIQDALKSNRNSFHRLVEQRIKKIVRRAAKNSRLTSGDEAIDGMTIEEAEIYEHMLSVLRKGRETILSHLLRTERPLTGKKDIGQEYEVVRLLDSVPIFVGVNGHRYLLSKGDLVALPSVHARNLCQKNLARQVKIESDKK
jgi:DNA replication factor GINS